MRLNNIAIIGTGAWGTALAQVLSLAGRNVTLYSRSAHLAKAINESHQNTPYLPGIALHVKIKATPDMKEAVAGADIVVSATPAQFMRETLGKIKPLLKDGVPVVNAAKGIEVATGKIPSEVAAEALPDHPYAALSGPTFADEVAKRLPAAVTLATKAPENTAMLWAEALSAKTFRPYLSFDPVGADISGALKNVIAIACGIVEGKKLGQNARAAVMTRGMAEIRRFGMTKGAQAETFLGLSGIGDLTLTCNSMSSRNFSLGVALGQGLKLADILASRSSVTEGIATAKAIAALAKKSGVDMPICVAVDQILHHGHDVTEVVERLLSRELKNEEA